MCRNCGICGAFQHCSNRLVFVFADRRTCCGNYNGNDNHAFSAEIFCEQIFFGRNKIHLKKILQWAVIILGFSLNLGTIASVGSKSLPVIISTISTSLITAFAVMKIAKIKPKTACLIGVGSSICGGSAIAATAPVIDADDEEIAQSISVIFLFNILAALIFPTFGHAVGFGTEGFAVFAGTAVNDTSSVTATAATAEKSGMQTVFCQQQ